MPNQSPAGELFVSGSTAAPPVAACRPTAERTSQQSIVVGGLRRAAQSVSGPPAQC